MILAVILGGIVPFRHDDLDAFHDGSAEILSVATRGGHVRVRAPGVTGTNVNPTRGYASQPTDVFLIKGTKSVSIVPTAP